MRSDAAVAQRVVADAPQPLDRLLDAAATELRSHGFTVAVSLLGDAAALPDSALRTLGGVFREVTSNIVKHGRPDGVCRMLVEVTPEVVEAAFVNTPLHPAREADHQHLGLVGIRERLGAHGGILETRQGASGWMTRIVLPVPSRGSDKEA